MVSGEYEYFDTSVAELWLLLSGNGSDQHHDMIVFPNISMNLIRLHFGEVHDTKHRIIMLMTWRH